MLKILFFSSIHTSFDDRSFHHQALALNELGHDVYIFSEIDNILYSEKNIKIISRNISNLSILKKIVEIKKLLSHVKPNVIICDYPTTALLLKIPLIIKKVKIIYDVTEWVPSKKNLNNAIFPLNIIKFSFLLFLNISAGLFVDKLIFGEYYKSLLFKFLSYKKKRIISYFPDAKYINSTIAEPLNHSIKLFYSGWFNFDKGFDCVLQLTTKIAELNPKKIINLEIVGNFTNKDSKAYYKEKVSRLPKNVSLNTASFMKFKDFCMQITTADVFLDLRKNDFENTHCLPIKLFYYMACGRPLIYTNLKAIKHEIDIEHFGYYFNGNNINELAINISKYFDNTELYFEHCNNALNSFKEKYHWDLIKKDYTDFIVN